MIKHLENENMKEIIKEGVWVVDFYAEWCGPCKMLGPVLEQLQENVLKINVDNHESLAQEYGVMSIPTICFFKDGELKNKVVGFRSKEEIEKLIASI
ncbi:MAG: thioredoxin [Bacilli bacterium]|jgi:thioredoxin 1|nr:thioredoxin [Bacilli bacterium]